MSSLRKSLPSTIATSASIGSSAKAASASQQGTSIRPSAPLSSRPNSGSTYLALVSKARNPFAERTELQLAKLSDHAICITSASQTFDLLLDDLPPLSESMTAKLHQCFEDELLAQFLKRKKEWEEASRLRLPCGDPVETNQSEEVSTSGWPDDRRELAMEGVSLVGKFRRVHPPQTLSTLVSTARSLGLKRLTEAYKGKHGTS